MLILKRVTLLRKRLSLTEAGVTVVIRIVLITEAYELLFMCLRMWMPSLRDREAVSDGHLQANVLLNTIISN